MIKRFSLKKIGKYTILLLAVFLFYMFPKSKEYSLEVSTPIKNNFHYIFLIDKNGYISKTKIDIIDNKKENLVNELFEAMTIDSKYKDKIPNGFNQIIPKGTKLLNKEIKDNVLILDFSKEFIEVKKEMEEKLVEALIYTMTEIEGIDTISIKIENKQFTKLPKSGKKIDVYLKRDFGINKIYDIDSLRDLTEVIIYYAAKTEDNYVYYVPVTKYINSNKDKIKIIIDELTSKISYESNLMSYLNYNAKLIDYSFNEDVLDLNFNEYLFDNNQDKKVLEEVIYSISYSIKDNYNVSKINFYVNSEEIK